MFLMDREEFKNYLSKNKRPFMANFYKIVRIKMNLLMNKNGTPKGNKWSFDEENRKKLPNLIKIPQISKVKDTKDTTILKKFINSKEIISKLKKIENKVPMKFFRRLRKTNYWLERIYERNLSKL